MSEQNGSFKGRVAFITGATRGIGKRIALDLAAQGCKVVVTGKTVSRDPRLDGSVAQTVDEISALGGIAMGQQLDVRNDEAVGESIARTVAVFGRIDYLINNAGAIDLRSVADQPLKRFDLVMGVNVRGSLACAYHALPHMQRQDYGHIIMMSPPLSREGICGKTGYAISKYGMTMLAQGLAEENLGYNIAANALWPATMIRSAATEVNGFGNPTLWRKPEIVSDAALRILAKEPKSFSGHELIDEEFLRAEGVSDFTKYRCDPAHEPPHIGFDFKPRSPT